MVAILLVVVALVAACTGGGGDAAPTTTDASTTGPGPTGPTTSEVAPATTVPPTTTLGVIDRLTRVWIGGDPVQWARDACLAAQGVVGGEVVNPALPSAAADACTDFPGQRTWPVALAACLAGRGMPVRLDGDHLAGPVTRGDPEQTAAAWEACRPVYVHAKFPTAVLPIDAAMWDADCLASKGWLSVLVRERVPDMQGDAEQCQSWVAMRACLRDNGAAGPEPAGIGTRVRYPVAQATTAWAACRELYIRTSWATGRVDIVLHQADCMAERGWLVADRATANGSPFDEYTVDLAACTPPDPAARFVRCLQDNGIEPAVSPSPAAPATMTRVEPAVARAAWAACRTAYVDAQNWSGDAVEEIMVAFPTCMAAHGWLPTGYVPSADLEATYRDDATVCSTPANGGALIATTNLLRLPTLDEWTACFADAGVGVARDAATATTARQVFDPAAVTGAYVGCGTRYLGFANSQNLTCAANRGVVPGLGGAGTWDVIAACGLVPLTLLRRTPPTAATPFLRCLVDNGVPLHPLLRTFDRVLPAWERCAAADPQSDQGVALAFSDNTEADLATLRYWACLADQGLRVPDPRVTSSRPDLDLARRALRTCAALAVTVDRPDGTYYGD